MRRRTSLPKPAARGLLIHVGDVLAGHAKAIAHAIVAGEVRRGLGRRHDIIGGQGIPRVRQRDVGDRRARVLQPGDPLRPQLFDFGRHAIAAVFLRDADVQALDAAPHRRLEIRHRHIDGGRVLRVMARHRAQAGSPRRAPCARSGPPDRARRRRRRCPSASSGHRSA